MTCMFIFTSVVSCRAWFSAFCSSSITMVRYVRIEMGFCMRLVRFVNISIWTACYVGLGHAKRFFTLRLGFQERTVIWSYTKGVQALGVYYPLSHIKDVQQVLGCDVFMPEVFHLKESVRKSWSLSYLSGIGYWVVGSWSSWYVTVGEEGRQLWKL